MNVLKIVWTIARGTDVHFRSSMANFMNDPLLRTRWSHLPSNELFALDRFQEYKFDTTSQDRRLPYSLTPQIDENVFLTDENDTRYKCPIAITNAPEHWSAFERLTIIWLLTSKLSDSADNVSLDKIIYYPK